MRGEHLLAHFVGSFPYYLELLGFKQQHKPKQRILPESATYDMA
jgi:hypothetical protein